MLRAENPIVRWLLLWALAALLLGPQSGFCADDLLTSQLVDEARQWQTKGRNDLAADTWHRILIVHPEHPEALASLGWLEARAGNLSQAQALYRRAKKTGKSTPVLLRLEARLREANADNPKDNQQLTPPSAPGSAPTSPDPRAGTRQSTSTTTPRSPPTPANGEVPVAPAKVLPSLSAHTEKTAKSAQSPKRAALPLATEPVAPPSNEIRVTPLPLPPIVDNRLTPIKNSNEEDVSLKPSDHLRTGATPPTNPTANSPVRRPKPCRLPLASGQTTGTN